MLPPVDAAAILTRQPPEGRNFRCLETSAWVFAQHLLSCTDARAFYGAHGADAAAHSSET